MMMIRAFAERHHVLLTDDSVLGPVVRGEVGIIYEDAGPDGPRLLLRLDGPSEGVGGGLKRVSSDGDERPVFCIPRGPMPNWVLTHQEIVALNVAQVPRVLRRWARRHGVEVQEGLLDLLIVAGEHGVLLGSADGRIRLELHTMRGDPGAVQARLDAVQRAGLRPVDPDDARFGFEFDPADDRLSRAALVLAGVPGVGRVVRSQDVQEAGAGVRAARGTASGTGAA